MRYPIGANWRIIKMLTNISLMITKSMFHLTAKELKELDKENDKKLLELLKYLRKRNDKKIKKGN